ncbi:insulin-like growth factor-binding complex acid labile subunit [Brachionus plicatilis]|uniref:Insulin-like growth factor-binding complex acid labile subunit n=1 Tax=Brachionus plicatilis TaxID=10195 RepID=A0A3M7SVQ9_BRAPC|nr:insulin-like growth factor-binding complex acid labile subunit [Brachionus plicatilis]
MESKLSSYFETSDSLCRGIDNILRDPKAYVQTYIEGLYRIATGQQSDVIKAQLDILSQICDQDMDKNNLSSLCENLENFKNDLEEIKHESKSGLDDIKKKSLKKYVKYLSDEYWNILTLAFGNAIFFIINDQRDFDNQKLIIFNGKFDSETVRYFHKKIDYFECSFDLNSLQKLISSIISESPSITPELLRLVQFSLHGFDDFSSNNTIVLFSVMDLNKLENLKLKNYGLSEIKLGAFNYCSNLKILDLSYNMIDALDEETFAPLENLTRLDLTFNKIKSLPRSAFKNLKKLLLLNLSDNDIVTLENGCFDGLDNLMQLSLSNNGIESLDTDYFVNLKNLKNLILDRNFLKVIHPACFKGLEKLRLLDLNSNLIEKIVAKSFCHCPYLNVLFLQDNCLSKLGRFIFKDLQILTSLNISKNRLAFVGETTFIDLINLRELDLSRNKLTEISEKVLLPLENLRYLNLKFNNDLETKITLKTNETAVVILPSKIKRNFMFKTGSNMAIAQENDSQIQVRNNNRPKKSISRKNSKHSNH